MGTLKEATKRFKHTLRVSSSIDCSLPDSDQSKDSHDEAEAEGDGSVRAQRHDEHWCVNIELQREDIKDLDCESENGVQTERLQKIKRASSEDIYPLHAKPS